MVQISPSQEFRFWEIRSDGLNCKAAGGGTTVQFEISDNRVETFRMVVNILDSSKNGDCPEVVGRLSYCRTKVFSCPQYQSSCLLIGTSQWGRYNSLENSYEEDGAVGQIVEEAARTGPVVQNAVPSSTSSSNSTELEPGQHTQLKECTPPLRTARVKEQDRIASTMEERTSAFSSYGRHDNRRGDDVSIGGASAELLKPVATGQVGSSEVASVADQDYKAQLGAESTNDAPATSTETQATCVSATIASPQGSSFTPVSGPEGKDPERSNVDGGFVTPEARHSEPKIKTLRDYVEPKPTKSPRGIDLEQIKASPRSEDLTKIKFARFVFNGVSTTVVSRSTKNVDGSSHGEIDEGGTPASPGGRTPASPVGRTPASPNGDHSRQSAADDASGGAFSAMHGTEDSDDLNLEKLASLTASRHRPIPHQLVEVDNEAWLGKLNVLSKNCIKKVGSESVGQEYTVRLKAAGKELDQALREGLGSYNISGFPQLEKHRWEAVQRLSAILHETHDAEVGLIHSEGRKSAETERSIWMEEMELCFKEEDAIRQRLREAREEEEAQVRAKWGEKLEQAQTSLFQRTMDGTLQRNQELMESMLLDQPLEEDSVVRVLNSVLEEQDQIAAADAPSPPTSAPSPTKTPSATKSEPPAARAAPLSARQPIAFATPRRVTSQAQVREAYALGSPGSLPLEMQADSPRGAPEAAARVRVGEAAGIASNLSSLNFIPENSLLASETPSARSSPNDSRLRFLF